MEVLGAASKASLPFYKPELYISPGLVEHPDPHAQLCPPHPPPLSCWPQTRCSMLAAS